LIREDLGTIFSGFSVAFHREVWSCTVSAQPTTIFLLRALLPLKQSMRQCLRETFSRCGLLEKLASFRRFSRVNCWRVLEARHGAFPDLGVAASSEVLLTRRTESSTWAIDASRGRGIEPGFTVRRVREGTSTPRGRGSNSCAWLPCAARKR
jgi:hypothetical protein